MLDNSRIPGMIYLATISGATGANAVLRGFRNIENVYPYSIHPTEDSGGSTGRLRQELNILGVGEITGRLIAMSPMKEAEELAIRYTEGEKTGHTVGNLLVADYVQKYGVEEGIRLLSKRYGIERGEIIPATLERFEICAECADGRILETEHVIDEYNGESPIKKVFARPRVLANPRAIYALGNVHAIVYGPSDPYSSIGQIMIVDGIPEAIRKSEAKQIYVANLMVPGEAAGMTLQDSIDNLEEMIGSPGIIDTVIVNSGKLPKEALQHYAAENKFPLDTYLDRETLKRVRLIKENLVSERIYGKSDADVLERSMLRHGSSKLAKAIIESLQK